MDHGVAIAIVASFVLPLVIFLVTNSPLRRELKACHDARAEDKQKIKSLEERCEKLEERVRELENEKLLLKVDEAIRRSSGGG